MPSRETKLGALWEKKNSMGGSFFSGVLNVNGEAIKIVVFKNGYKKEERQPDYEIFASEPKPQATGEVIETVTGVAADEMLANMFGNE